MNVFRSKKEFNQFSLRMKDKKVLIVFDVNTAVFYEEVAELESYCKTQTYCFNEKHLIPEISNLKELILVAKSFDYILGIGSGTLNDICKYVSFTNAIPYGIFATAPSMDGYVSSVSALYDNGKKVTLPTTIPSDVFINVEVLKNAPLNMIVAGAGDMVGKYTSLLDWKFANLLNGEKYDIEIAKRMEKAVELCISQARNLVSRDKSAVSSLMEGLILSGIEMQNAGNSRPASGCEHHISHYLEMAGEKLNTHFAPHGVQVALGSLVGISLYNYALTENLEDIRLIASDIKQLPTVDDLKTLYKEIGLPYYFKDIGVDQNLLKETIANAYTVRERFTIMSFLKNNNRLDIIAEILAKDL